MPQLLILAGPNGAGKTTAAKRLLPYLFKIKEFVNADEIARGLSPFNPESAAIAAGRLMLDRIGTLLTERKDFAFETTLSGTGHSKAIRQARRWGYRVQLVFISLPNPDVAISRVHKRVASGGHSIPDEVIIRRYYAGLRNLFYLYLGLVDEWSIVENADNGLDIIARGYAEKEPEIVKLELWEQLKIQARAR